MEVEVLTDDAGTVTGVITVMTTAKGKEVRTEYAAVTQRAVRDLLSGIESYDRDNVHFHQEGAKRARRTRSAGRKDAVSILGLEKQ